MDADDVHKIAQIKNEHTKPAESKGIGIHESNSLVPWKEELEHSQLIPNQDKGDQ